MLQTSEGNQFLVSDRNVGAPQEGVALNYTSDERHPDHKNSDFKGGYYTWEEAKTACPSGWRLPSLEELEVFINTLQFTDEKAYIADSKGNRCYFPLSGTSDNPPSENGYYWSSTENEYYVNSAWYLNVTKLSTSMDNLWHSYKDNGFSVRCVKTVD